MIAFPPSFRPALQATVVSLPRMGLPTVLALAYLLAATSGILAADLPAASTAAGLPGPASGALALVRVIGALAIVFAVFFGGLWLFRNWQRFVVSKGRAPRLAVYEAKSLGQRHTLYVVGYEQQRLLVATSPAGVTMLTALPPGEWVAPAPAPETAAPGRTNFGALLLKAMARPS